MEYKPEQSLNLPDYGFTIIDDLAMDPPSANYWQSLQLPTRAIAELQLFFRACAWLYGNISLTKAYEIYTSYPEHKTTKKDFLQFVKLAKKDNFENCFYKIIPLAKLYSDYPHGTGAWHQEVISNAIWDEDDPYNDLFYDMYDNKRQYQKPYLILPLDELYKYAHYDYLPHISEYDKITKFLKNLGFITDQRIRNFLERFKYNTHCGSNVLDFLRQDILMKELYKKCSVQVLNQLLEYLQNAANKSSHMHNNGYSPVEMRKMAKQELGNKSPQIVFSERMEREIVSGRMSTDDFMSFVERLPSRQHKAAALQEFSKLRPE